MSWTQMPPACEIVDKLNSEINAGLANPRSRSGCQLGSTPMPMTPAEFGELISDETGKAIRAAGIQPG
jgi:hypothetical protein